MTPPRPKFVTYFRVSTQKQGRSGLGLDAQQHEVRRYLFQTGGLELASFTEVESGKTDDRPQLAAALRRCRQARATLLVAKIDRLSRDVAFLFSLRKSGVSFQALDISDANTLNLGVMIVMAQHERELIAKRTREALAARRAKGLPMGTPRDMSGYQQQASELGCFANRAKAQARAKEIAPAIEEARTAGRTSLRQIATFLNEQGIQTPRGKSWTATAVRNALEQLKAA